jgi:hypothetical protein
MTARQHAGVSLIMISCAAMMRSERAFRKPVDSRLALLAVEADEGYLWFWIGSQVRGSDSDGSHAASHHHHRRHHHQRFLDQQLVRGDRTGHGGSLPTGSPP